MDNKSLATSTVVGYVVAKQGDVTIIRHDGTILLADKITVRDDGNKGTPIFRGDKIKTHCDSQLVFENLKGQPIVIGASQEIHLNGVPQGPGADQAENVPTDDSGLSKVQKAIAEGLDPTKLAPTAAGGEAGTAAGSEDESSSRLIEIIKQILGSHPYGDSYPTDWRIPETELRKEDELQFPADRQPVIGLAKDLIFVQRFGEKTEHGCSCVVDGQQQEFANLFQAQFKYTLSNLGPIDLTKVTLIDDLAAAFGPGVQIVSVSIVSTSAGLTANAGYNGVTDKNMLLLDQSELDIGESGTVVLNVTFAVNQFQDLPYFNTATAVGITANGVMVTDISDDGLKPDPNGDGNPNQPGENDPTPIIIGNPVNTIVDEDDLGHTILQPGGTDTTPESTSVTGLLNLNATGITIEDIRFTPGLVVPYTSMGAPIIVTLSPDGHTLTGTSNGRPIFTMDLDVANQKYTFTLLGNIDHPTGNGENNVSFDVGFRVAFNGGDFYSDCLHVKVIDDIPVVTGNKLHVTVEEEQLSGGNEDTASASGLDHDTVGNLNITTNVATGNISNLVNFGADGAGGFSFKTDLSSLQAQALTQNGVALSYSVMGNVLTATAAGSPVFTLTLDTNGHFTFELKGSIDHPLYTQEDTLAVDFSGVIKAVDGDGDPASLGTGSFVIDVIDDIPIAKYATISYDESAHQFGADEKVVNPANLLAVSSVLNDVFNNAVPTVVGLATTTVDYSAGADGLKSLVLSNGDNTLTSDGKPIVISNFDDHTVVGKADGNVVFVVNIDPSTKVATFVQFAEFDHANPNDPNDLLSIKLNYTVTDKDLDKVTQPLTIKVLDDGPKIVCEPGKITINECELQSCPTGVIGTGTFVVDYGRDHDGRVELKLPNLDLTSFGKDVIFTLSADKHTLIGKTNGWTVFELTLTDKGNGVFDYKFTLDTALDHNGAYDKSLPLDFAVNVFDGDNDAVMTNICVNVLDGEPKLSGKLVSGVVEEEHLAKGNEDTTSASGLDKDTPQNFAITTNIAKGDLSATISFCADKGEFCLIGDKRALDCLKAQNLTSCGTELDYKVVGNVLTATAGGNVVFTLTLQSDGKYEFVLKGALDHPLYTQEDLLKIDFSAVIKVSDSDGDKVTLTDNTFTIKVIDDVPVAQPAVMHYDESADQFGSNEKVVNNANLQEIKPLLSDIFNNSIPAIAGLATVTVSFSAGADGLKSLVLSNGDNTLTSDGKPIVISNFDDHTVVGKADGSVVFVVNIDPSTKVATFVQFAEFDHANPNDPNDLLSIKLNYTVTDKDLDKVTQPLTIKVLDDGPKIVCEPGKITINECELQSCPTGVIGTGTFVVDYGRDHDGRVELKLPNLDLSSFGKDVIFTLSADKHTLIGKTNGWTVFELTLTDKGNGVFDYKFTLDTALDHNGAYDKSLPLDFAVNVFDGDNDAVMTNICVNVLDGEPKLSGKLVSGVVEEEHLLKGNEDTTSASGLDKDTHQNFAITTNIARGDLTATVTFCTDKGDFCLMGDKRTIDCLKEQCLTSCGTELDYKVVGNVLTATAGGNVIFTLTLQSDGKYEFVLKGPLDHPLYTQEDTLKIDFSCTVKVVDSDGDVLKFPDNTFTIKVIDDVPVAQPAVMNYDESANMLGTNEIVVNAANLTAIKPVLSDVFNNNIPAIAGLATVTVSFSAGADGLKSLVLSNGDNTLTSDGKPIVISNFDDHTVVGKADGNVVFVVNIDPSTKVATFVQFAEFDHANPNDPNDLLSIKLNYTVTDKDLDKVTQPLTIQVLDDGPKIVCEPGKITINECEILSCPTGVIGTGTFVVDYGRDHDGRVELKLPNLDLSSFGKDVTFVLSPDKHTLIGKTNGWTVFELSLTDKGNGVFDYKFTLDAAVDHKGVYDKSLPLDFAVNVFDGDNDAVMTNICVTVLDGEPKLSGKLASGVVEEEHLAKGNEDTASASGLDKDTSQNFNVTTNIAKGDLTAIVSFCADKGDFCLLGDSKAIDSLKDQCFTSHGIALDYKVVGNVLTATAGSNVVFTLTLQSDGKYEFVLKGPMDHPLYTQEDLLKIDFSAVIKVADSDGDVLKFPDNTFTIKVIDDIPVSAITTITVTPDNNPTICASATGKLNAAFGQDGPGDIVLLKSLADLYVDGQKVVISQGNGHELIGKVGNNLVFSLTVDPTDLSYKFLQYQKFDDPKINGQDEKLVIDFKYTITDYDKDTVNGNLIINAKAEEPGPRGAVITVCDTSFYEDGKADVVNQVTAPAQTINVQFSVQLNDANLDKIVSVTIGNIPTGVTAVDSRWVLNGSTLKTTDATLIQQITQGNTVNVALKLPLHWDKDLSLTVSADITPKVGGVVETATTNDKLDVLIDAVAAKPKIESLSINVGADNVVKPSEVVKFQTAITFADLTDNTATQTGQERQTINIIVPDASWLLQGSVKVAFNGSSVLIPADNLGNGNYKIDVTNFLDQLSGNPNIAKIDVSVDVKAPANLTAGSQPQFKVIANANDTATDGEKPDANNHAQDSATTKVAAAPVDPVLVIGTNCDDDSKAPSTQVHTIPNPSKANYGIIYGNDGADVLVGDVGGVLKIPGIPAGNYAVAFVIDVSGSMADRADGTSGSADANHPSRLSVLKASLTDLVTKLAAHDGVVNLYLQPFSDVSKTPLSIMDFGSQASHLATALAFINNLTANGYTNYQDPLLDAQNWFKGQLNNGFHDIAYFLSDGEPNRINQGNGSTSASETVAINTAVASAADLINPTDGVLKGGDAVALYAIGIGDDINKSTLLKVDNTPVGQPSVDIIRTGEELDQALDRGLPPTTKLEAVGKDEIHGGKGDDVIFGDVLNSDNLASAQFGAAGTHNGVGYDALVAYLKDQNGGQTPSVSEMLNYIKANQEVLSGGNQETRGEADKLYGNDGNDTIYGQGGTDTVYGEEGNDILIGGSGNDILYGGTGADVFDFGNGHRLGVDVDDIKDFNAQQDILNLSDLITGNNITAANIDLFVKVKTVGDVSTVMVNSTGSGNSSDFVSVATLHGSIDAVNVIADPITHTQVQVHPDMS